MMPPIPSFSPTWMLLLMVVVFLIAATSASRRLRQHRLGRWDVRVCDRCGTSQPPHAAYCRQCGIRLT
jgi:ribosomal protein L40E